MKRILTGALAALLSVAAFGATLTPIQLLSPTGSTSGQVIKSTGPSTAPAWGNVSVSSLATQAANTVLANSTGSTATPTAFAMPSCSAAGNALNWTSGTGFTCATGNALTANPLSQFAATTSAQLLGIISDETGSGSLVFGTSPTIGTATLNTPTIAGGTINNATVGIATPLAGKFTTLTATSTITPSSTAGIVGTATNDSANVGSVGEAPAPVCASGIALTTGTTANVASINLTAGDWDIQGTVQIAAAAGTSITNSFGGISPTTATISGLGTYWQMANSFSTGALIGLPTPTVQQKLTSTTTIFLVANASFSGSTASANGCIRARRPR